MTVYSDHQFVYLFVRLVFRGSGLALSFIVGTIGITAYCTAGFRDPLPSCVQRALAVHAEWNWSFQLDSHFFIYVWLHWVFIALHGFSLVVTIRGYFLVVVHWLTRPMACGIFPDQGLNWCPCTARQILNHWTVREALPLLLNRLSRDFPGGPVVKTPCFCRGLRFNPCSGN